MVYKAILILTLSVLYFCMLVTAAENTPFLSFDAALHTRNDVEVKTRLTGIIAKIYVDRGSWVKKGEPLAELQNDDLALEIKKAKVSMEELKAEYDRAKSLHDQELLSDSEYDAKRLGYERAVAEHELAGVEFEKSIIKAPFSGVVDELYAKIGQRVVEDENVPLFRITALEPLQARIFVPENQIASISVGLKADFVPTVSPSQRFAARVKWISSSIDPASGTAPAIVELAPGAGRGILRPGTSGKVIIYVKSVGGQPSK
jgi:RND family efflux transporter MFP subunit